MIRDRIYRSTLLLVLLGCAMVPTLTPAAGGKTEQLISVLNPTGFPPAIERKPMAERPASLNGRPVYLVDLTFDNGDVFLKEMQKWFAAEMPSVNTIFRAKKGAYYTDDPDLWSEIKAANGLMIMAIGH